MGYVLFIAGTMLVLPVTFFLIQKTESANTLELLGKWFIFWGVGVRLSIAGLIQVFNPSMTASILGLEESTYIIIRELGFANVIFGLMGLLSLFYPGLRLAATAGGFYMGLAGIYHVVRLEHQINIREKVALVSDLWILLVVLGYCLFTLRK